MTAYAATGAYSCPCGATTHIFMECDDAPPLAAIHCWHCGKPVGRAAASRLWSASTVQGACRLSLIGRQAGPGQTPRNPQDHEVPVTQVWRVL
jgi:hypothetical protein